MPCSSAIHEQTRILIRVRSALGFMLSVCRHGWNSVDHILHVAERARLRPVAVHRDVASEQRLQDEIGYHPPIVRLYARAIGVENPGDLDGKGVLAPMVEEQGLGAMLALVGAGARADRAPPVTSTC